MKLQPREKKFVLGAFAAAFLFAVLQFLVLPQWDHANSGPGTLDQAQEELRTSRELIAAKQLREQDAALRNQLRDEDRRLLVAPNANQAGAQFQTWLTTAAAAQQLTFVRSEFLAPAAVGQKYLRIPVRLELMGRITQITQFLAAITTGDRIVSVDEIDLNSGGDKEKQIRCGVVVAALMAKPK